MEDLFSNAGFIIIAILVFIIRAIFTIKKKNAPPPGKPADVQTAVEVKPKPKPLISVHFEDDPEDYKGPSAAAAAVKIYAPKTAKRRFDQPLFSPEPVAAVNFMPVSHVSAAPGATVKVSSRAAAEENKGFPHNLHKLSPLKQAVVMAEILGPPKGLQ
jgi:hypothetical protein